MPTTEQQLAAIRADLQSATADLRAQCDRLDALVRGNDQQPGLGTRVTVLEQADTRRRNLLLAVWGATWAGLVGLAVRIFGGGTQ